MVLGPLETMILWDHEVNLSEIAVFGGKVIDALGSGKSCSCPHLLIFSTSNFAANLSFIIFLFPSPELPVQQFQVPGQ